MQDRSEQKADQKKRNNKDEVRWRKKVHQTSWGVERVEASMLDSQKKKKKWLMAMMKMIEREKKKKLLIMKKVR